MRQFFALFMALNMCALNPAQLYSLFAATSFSCFACATSSLKRGAYRCPYCGAMYHISPHGTYVRMIKYLDCTDTFVTVTVKVQRFYCCSCNHTFSLIPDFLVPWSSYAMESILRVLRYYFTEKSRYDEAIAAGKRKGYRGLRKNVAAHFGISESILKSWLAKFDRDRQNWPKWKTMSELEFVDFILNYDDTCEPGYGIFAYQPPKVKGYSAFVLKYWRLKKHSFMQNRRDVSPAGRLKARPGFLKHGLTQQKRDRVLRSSDRTVKVCGWFEMVTSTDIAFEVMPSFAAAMPWNPAFINKAAGKEAV